MEGEHRQRTTPAARRTYTLLEAAAVIGIGESSIRKLVAAGTLPSVRVGARVLLPRQAVDDFADGVLAQPAGR